MKKTRKMLSFVLAFVMMASLLMVGAPGMVKAATLFGDDFQDGNATGWTPQSGYDNWSVVDDGSGNYVYYNSTTTEGRTKAGNSAWTDYSVEAKVKVVNFNGSNRAYVCGRYLDGNNYYCVSLMSGTLEIRKKISGSSSTLVSKSYTFSTNTWYTVKLEMVGTSLKAYVNGTQELSTTDSARSSGSIGLVAYKTQTKYDDIVVSDTSGGTPTPTPTATPVPTATPTPDPNATPTPTPAPTATPTPTPTPAPTATPQPTPAAGDLFVDPNGLDSNPGTIGSPTTFTKAITTIAAGNTIFMRGGTYTYDYQITIARGNDGTSSAKKKITAYNNEVPVLDFSSQPYGNPSSVTNPRGLQINGHYWNVYGIECKGSADNGMYIGGNYNTIEKCKFYNNRDSGLQLGRYLSTCTREEWPAYNLIKNCDSYDNRDPDNGEDADGYGCKLTTGPGNVFDGCVAHHNVDDGWDLYTKSETGAIDPVTITNCIAYNNGVTSDGTYTPSSDGNGFKLGGESIQVNHIVSGSIAFQNRKHGFTYNSNPGSIALTNCTSWDNGKGASSSNFAFDTGTHQFKNLLSYSSTASDKTSGTDIDQTNVWWKNGASTNAKGLVCSTADFVSLTPSVSRNTDGTINLGNFLALATGSDLIGSGSPSGTNIGAR